MSSHYDHLNSDGSQEYEIVSLQRRAKRKKIEVRKKTANSRHH
jgi:hypothetical protein